MTLHTELPIYKKGRELVALAFHVQQQMPRSFKRTLGEKITVHCTDMHEQLVALSTPLQMETAQREARRRMEAGLVARVEA